MTTIEIYKSKSFGYYKLIANEHADDSKVCAAISAVTQGLAGALMNIEPKPNIERMIIESGKFEIEVRPMTEEEDQKIIDTVFFTSEIALAQIQKTSPHNVTICRYFY